MSRDEVVEMLLRYCGDSPPDLGDLEFTRNDWKRVMDAGGKARSIETAKRDLRLLVERGVLERGERYDLRTERNCVGYWVAEGAPGELRELVGEVLGGKDG